MSNETSNLRESLPDDVSDTAFDGAPPPPRSTGFPVSDIYALQLMIETLTQEVLATSAIEGIELDERAVRRAILDRLIPP